MMDRHHRPVSDVPFYLPFSVSVKKQKTFKKTKVIFRIQNELLQTKQKTKLGKVGN